MTAGVLLETAASLLTVELFDEVPEELLVPEPLLEYERLLEYEPPLEEKLVRFLLLVYPDFLDQLLYFLLVELLEEPLYFVLVYPDFLLVVPDFVLVYPDFLPVVEPELLLPFEEDLEVSLSEYARRGGGLPFAVAIAVGRAPRLAECRLR